MVHRLNYSRLIVTFKINKKQFNVSVSRLTKFQLIMKRLFIINFKRLKKIKWTYLESTRFPHRIP